MRLIDADALAEKKFQERECNGLGEGPAYRQGWNDAIDAVMDNEPSAQPKTGHWILDRSGKYCCSKCMEPCATYIMMRPRDKFCKMCGAKMEGE